MKGIKGLNQLQSVAEPIQQSIDNGLQSGNDPVFGTPGKGLL